MLKDTFAEGHELMTRKNSDYCPKDNPLANVQTPFTDAQTGILVRMGDKFSRLANLYTKEEVSVKDESFDDTLIDLMNYACILLSYRKLKD